MKKILLLAIALFPAIVWAQTSEQSAPTDQAPQAAVTQAPARPTLAVRLGVVNSDEIFNLMPEKATAETTLKGYSDKYQAEYKKLQTEFNQKYADFQALSNDGSIPATIKERRMQELQENDKKIQEFQNKANTDLKAQQQQLTAPIREKINKAIQAVGEEGGYAMIFDTATTSIPYTSIAVDVLTDRVKEKLGIK